jgi:hypothetical protein
MHRFRSGGLSQTGIVHAGFAPRLVALTGLFHSWQYDKPNCSLSANVRRGIAARGSTSITIITPRRLNHLKDTNPPPSFLSREQCDSRAGPIYQTTICAAFCPRWRRRGCLAGLIRMKHAAEEASMGVSLNSDQYYTGNVLAGLCSGSKQRLGFA